MRRQPGGSGLARLHLQDMAPRDVCAAEVPGDALIFGHPVAL
jgi:hypothetical protein